MSRLALFVAVCLLPASLAAAQDPDADELGGAPVPELPEVIARNAEGMATVRALHLPSPLIFDGRLDEAFYRDVKSFGDFIQQEPHEGQPATDNTECWIFFDEKNVYVSVRLWETDKSKRVMSDMRRDAFNLYNNDHIAFVFDTFDDRRNAFGFSSNAQGGIFDFQVTNEQPNPNWNGVWDVKTAEFEGGWTAEFRIPFRSMRFREGSTVWRVNFRRMVRWKNEVSYLSPVPLSWGRRGIGKISSAGPLVGLATPSRLKNLDVKPYALGSLVTNLTSTPAVHNKGNAEFGVDAKWGITQQLVADFTYNTDFAQVEDDEAQVNLTRFSVLFPEKRDFFLEGQEVFNFGGPGGGGGGGGAGGPQAIRGGGGGGGENNVTPILFYSRRIGLQNGRVVPILGGARLMGRSGAYRIGALHLRTGEERTAGAAPTDFSVFRLNRDILRRSRVGLIATRRAPHPGATFPFALGAGENYAYGVDTQINPRTDMQVNAYWAGSSGSTGSAGSTGSTGSAGSLDAARTSYRGQVNWNADRAGLNLDHLFVGERFNPEVGYLRRSALRRTFGQARYSPRPASWQGVRKVYYEGSVDYLEDPHGHPESRELQAAFRMELTSSDQWAFEYSRQVEALTGNFRATPGLLVPPGTYEFTQGRLLVTLSPQRPVSGTLVLTRGGFYNGTLNEISWRGRVEFGPQFQVEPTLSLNYFDTPWGRGDAHLAGGRVTYTLTPKMFVSALVQYQSSSDTVTTNARFRWEYQPGSEVFVVYSDGRSTLSRGFPPALENRTFVVKLTRLLRY